MLYCHSRAEYTSLWCEPFILSTFFGFNGLFFILVALIAELCLETTIRLRLSRELQGPWVTKIVTTSSKLVGDNYVELKYLVEVSLGRMENDRHLIDKLDSYLITIAYVPSGHQLAEVQTFLSINSSLAIMD